EITVSWTLANTGTAPVVADFLQRVRVVHAVTGQSLVDSVVPYSIAAGGVLGVGTHRSQSATERVPDVSASAGELQVSVTVDSTNVIFELSATGNAEANNTAATAITAALAPYPDLAVSAVVAPGETIADPANVTISWRVDNLGTLAAHGDN